MSVILRKTLTTTLPTLLLVAATPTTAQIIPDSSLPVNSVVVPNGNVILIDGGTKAGNNLFHSFQTFSVLEGETAIFNNGLNIANIFSRVTGGSISQIQGILAAQGTANLFFLNPRGLIFGPNAALALGGSFLGSTANRVIFADGFEFKTQSSEKVPLLSISQPRELGFGNNPGQIIVQGSGHQLRLATDLTVGSALGIPILGGGQSTTGLRTAPGKTLALIGGEIIVDGGNLTAFSGAIELGSVAQSSVKLQPHEQGLAFNYEGANQFQDIRLDNQALLDASGLAHGQINLQGRNISIEDGAALMISNLGDVPTGTVQIRATESVNLRGISDFSQFSLEELNSNTVIRGIYSQTFANGKGADISISAKDLVVQNFSTINALSFGAGEGGSLRLQVRENLVIDGNNPLFAFLPSSIASLGTGSGKAGDLLISGQRLLIQNGGLLLSQTLGVGEGGQIDIGVSDLVQVSGAIAVNPEGTEFIPSLIGNSTLFSQNAGNVVISTEKLKVDSGGLINANTNATGNAGNILIEANSLEISGQVPSVSGEFTVASQISSAADSPTPFFLELFNLSAIPAGNAGSIRIKAGELILSDGGSISVRNEGTGEGGKINLSAKTIFLESGNISAQTESGRGGNILINSDSLSLFNDSKLTATAGENGNGGNIALHTDSLYVISSAITAQAFKGRGGNIDINASELALISPDSIISASSQLGIDGEVRFNTDSFQIQNLTSLPVNFSPEVLLSRSCFAGKPAQVSFLWQGPGGLPLDSEVSTFPIPLPGSPSTSQVVRPQLQKGMRLANRLVRTEDGRLFLLGDEGDLPPSFTAEQKCDG